MRIAILFFCFPVSPGLHFPKKNFAQGWPESNDLQLARPIVWPWCFWRRREFTAAAPSLRPWASCFRRNKISAAKAVRERERSSRTEGRLGAVPPESRNPTEVHAKARDGIGTCGLRFAHTAEVEQSLLSLKLKKGSSLHRNSCTSYSAMLFAEDRSVNESMMKVLMTGCMHLAFSAHVRALE